jgi:hypothetical protein
MPEFPVKEVRLSELHLPEIKRDDIVRSLSGIHIADVDLPRVKRRKLVPGVYLAKLRWRQRGLSRIDIGKLIAAAVTAVRFVRPAAPRSRWSPIRRSRGNLMAIVRPAPRRSRRRFALVALVVAALAGWALLRNPGTRSRLDRAARKARQWIDEMRAHRSEEIDLDAGEPVSVTTGEIASTIDDEVIAAQAEAAESSQQAISPA